MEKVGEIVPNVIHGPMGQILVNVVNARGQDIRINTDEVQQAIFLLEIASTKPHKYENIRTIFT